VAPRVLNLNTVVAEAERMLQRVIGEDIELAVALDATSGYVRADPWQLAQVLLNLAVNARDAMPRGGKLTVETRKVQLDEGYTRRHTGAVPGSYVLLSVSDTGCGITQEVRERLFEPFFTTKGPGKGTGLGLATVHGIVTQSGGRIEVYSEPEQGATFKVYLPRVDDVVPSSRPSAGAAPAARTGETVLLVEDDAKVRRLTGHILQSAGYLVLEAGDGADALRVGERERGPINLLVTDVVMPILGGRQLAERLRALHPETRVLYLSGYTDDAVVRHGMLESESAFLPKPFSAVVLAHKVREVLDK
jgi:CheY-like chemotaxis protein